MNEHDENIRRRTGQGDVRGDYDDLARDPLGRVDMPGKALMGVGWLSLVAGVLTIAAGVWMAVAFPRRGPGAGVAAITILVMMTLVGFMTIAPAVAMIVGGSRLRQLRSPGWVMAAAVAAIVSFLIGVCGVFTLPVGIWALLVAMDPDVKREFARRRTDTIDDYGDPR